MLTCGVWKSSGKFGIAADLDANAKACYEVAMTRGQAERTGRSCRSGHHIAALCSGSSADATNKVRTGMAPLYQSRKRDGSFWMRSCPGTAREPSAGADGFTGFRFKSTRKVDVTEPLNQRSRRNRSCNLQPSSRSSLSPSEWRT